MVQRKIRTRTPDTQQQLHQYLPTGQKAVSSEQVRYVIKLIEMCQLAGLKKPLLYQKLRLKKEHHTVCYTRSSWTLERFVSVLRLRDLRSSFALQVDR